MPPVKEKNQSWTIWWGGRRERHQNNVVCASYKCTGRKNGIRYKAESHTIIWTESSSRCFIFHFILITTLYSQKRNWGFKRLFKVPKMTCVLWESQDPHPNTVPKCKLLELCDALYSQRHQYKSISTYLGSGYCMWVANTLPLSAMCFIYNLTKEYKYFSSFRARLSHWLTI